MTGQTWFHFRGFSSMALARSSSRSRLFFVTSCFFHVKSDNISQSVRQYSYCQYSNWHVSYDPTAWHTSATVTIQQLPTTATTISATVTLQQHQIQQHYSTATHLQQLNTSATIHIQQLTSPATNSPPLRAADCTFFVPTGAGAGIDACVVQASIPAHSHP